MRILLSLLAVGAVLASFAWTVALPPSVVATRACVTSVVAPGPYPKTATDPLGQPIVLRALPRRIVSLALSADDILIDLVPPERIAGLTVFVDHASTSVASGRAPKSAARVTGEPESLLALAPDLVIASAYTRPESLSLLEGAGVPVIGTGSLTTFEEVMRAVATIGEAVGEPGRSASMIAAMRQRIDAAAARKRGPPKRVLLWDGGFTYGKGTLQDEMVRIAGGENVAAPLRGPSALTEEAAVSLAPDVIIVPVDGANIERNAALVGQSPIWRAVASVDQKEVYGVPRAWITGCISHHSVLALEAISGILNGSKWGA